MSYQSQNTGLWVLSLTRVKQQTPNLHDESSNLSGPAMVVDNCNQNVMNYPCGSVPKTALMEQGHKLGR